MEWKEDIREKLKLCFKDISSLSDEEWAVIITELDQDDEMRDKLRDVITYFSGRMRGFVEERRKN